MHQKIVIKAIQNPYVERQFRHVYDIVVMADSAILEKALADKENKEKTSTTQEYLLSKHWSCIWFSKPLKNVLKSFRNYSI